MLPLKKLSTLGLSSAMLAFVYFKSGSKFMSIFNLKKGELSNFSI